MSWSRLESYKRLVSVSSQNFNVSYRPHLGWWSQRLGLVSVSGGERLGLVSVSSFYVSCLSLVCCLIAYKLLIPLAMLKGWVVYSDWRRSEWSDLNIKSINDLNSRDGELGHAFWVCIHFCQQRVVDKPESRRPEARDSKTRRRPLPGFMTDCDSELVRHRWTSSCSTCSVNKMSYSQEQRWIVMYSFFLCPSCILTNCP